MYTHNVVNNNIMYVLHVQVMIQSFPGNKISPLTISAKMHPTDQMSTEIRVCVGVMDIIISPLQRKQIKGNRDAVHADQASVVFSIYRQNSDTMGECGKEYMEGGGWNRLGKA